MVRRCFRAELPGHRCKQGSLRFTGGLEGRLQAIKVCRLVVACAQVSVSSNKLLCREIHLLLSATLDGDLQHASVTVRLLDDRAPDIAEVRGRHHGRLLEHTGCGGRWARAVVLLLHLVHQLV